MRPILKIKNRVLPLAEGGFLNAYSYMRSITNHQIFIITHHKVSSMCDWHLQSLTVSELESQIKYILKTFKIISLEELTMSILDKKPIPRRAVAITFDDGYRDVYTNAFPIFKKYDIPMTIFLTVDPIEKRELFWFDKVSYVIWNTELKNIELDDFCHMKLENRKDRSVAVTKILYLLKKIPEEQKLFMIEKLIKNSDVYIPQYLGDDTVLSWEEIKEMSDFGINFGAHSMTHPILTKITTQHARYEVVQSKKKIEEKLKYQVTSFSYPNGLYKDINQEIIDIVRDAGFKSAVTQIPCSITLRSCPLFFGRLSGCVGEKSFRRYMSGLYTDILSPYVRYMRTDI